MFVFRRITLFCLEKRLSKHKMTTFSKNLGSHGPFSPRGYAYGCDRIIKKLIVYPSLRSTAKDYTSIQDFWGLEVCNGFGVFGGH